MTVIHKNS